MFTDRYLGFASELVTKHDGGVWSSQSSGTRSARACIVEEPGGTRLDRLFEVRPQEWDQRRTVVQIVDSPHVVPSLDVPLPQMENQLVDLCRQLDIRIPEQAIEVPKISSSSRFPWRPQTAEQLVEVLTTVSVSSLRALVEQNEDIPFPRGRGGGSAARSSRFLPGTESNSLSWSRSR